MPRLGNVALGSWAELGRGHPLQWASLTPPGWAVEGQGCPLLGALKACMSWKLLLGLSFVTHRNTYAREFGKWEPWAIECGKNLYSTKCCLPQGTCLWPGPQHICPKFICSLASAMWEPHALVSQFAHQRSLVAEVELRPSGATAASQIRGSD